MTRVIRVVSACDEERDAHTHTLLILFGWVFRVFRVSRVITVITVITVIRVIRVDLSHSIDLVGHVRGDDAR